MIKILINAWKIADLRKKLYFTIGILIVYRLGSGIPVPFIDSQALVEMFSTASGRALTGYLDLLTGGAFTQATIFALAVSPYITASIVIQLLTIAIPALERMVKEGGEEGKKKQAALMRYGTVVLGLIEGFVYFITLSNGAGVIDSSVPKWWAGIVIVLSFTAGSTVVMWLGEQIDKKGVGNGISMILFAGILARFPHTVSSTIENLRNGSLHWIVFILMVAVALVLIAFVVYVSQAERRLPVQYAKRVVGRKVYGGQATHIPLKVNMTGVMPIIFASSIVSLPQIISSFFPVATTGFWAFFTKYFTAGENASWVGIVMHGLIYFGLIIAFSFFYAFVQYNPVEMANNMRDNGGFIPGLRPGRSTAEYIARVMKNITFIGALVLGLVALLPIMVSAFSTSLRGITLGGTTVLIVVGVALDTVRALEAQMLMRHYKGFLE